MSRAARRAKPTSLSFPLLLALPLLAICATTPANPNTAKYPPRGKACKVRVFYAAVPEVKEWDDLGMASVDCYLDVGAVQCLSRLRQEACRMGGDILYDVPKKALRPTDQGMAYRGHVGHTKQKPEEKGKDDADDGQDQPAQDSGPVEPIPPSLPAASANATGAADGGAAPDGTK